jgi:hypothetical protein
VSIIEDGKAAGAFPNAEPHDDAAAIFSLAVGRLMELKRTKCRDAAQAIEACERFALRALSA